MAFPTHTHAVASNTADTTTHNWTLPSGNAAGKLLILILALDGNPTVSGLTGFMQLFREADAALTLEVWYKFTDGGEASGTFTTSASEKSIVHALIMTDAHASLPPEAASLNSGVSATGDPPALNPAGWGAEDTRWFAFVMTSDATDESVAWDDIASYTAINNTDSGGTSSDVQTKLWYRDNNTASEDPGTFNFDGTPAYLACTIGVAPSGAAATLGQPAARRRIRVPHGVQGVQVL